MQVSAPAKINLFLKVLRRRPDGFHEIETFISPISLCDQIKIDKNKRGQGISFRCDDPSVPRGGENLAVRAANAFFAATQMKPAVSIVLKKKIPHGAGLGGGSSDAAAVLLALNQLLATKLSREKLAKLGSTIGSDVPFFIFESAAVCTGRGEIVTPRKLTEQLSILLVKPDFGVSTPWAYKRWQNSRELPGISYVQQDFRGQKFHNELERPVFEKFVFLARIKMWLLEQKEVAAALMSGSGSTVFAVLRQSADVDLVSKRAKAQLDPELWTCVVETREVDRPVVAAAASMLK
ncbi:MAG TPA: 4-(cytidine 5'-diphospho)-2-C-methyl-D-erythritol kinase [Chthoniobacterales bacterium]|nr:4-(cytidine 5'-diphospho)-2-C-methyl-D-erythritol kinase [Chthoniobacterales bacterium]